MGKASEPTATMTHSVMIVASRFNDLVVHQLINGATDAWRRAHLPAKELKLVRCAGAWELPLLADAACAMEGCVGVVALGCIIKGETAHFDVVNAGACNGLMQVSLKHGKPVSLGVLAVDDLAQALDRAGGKLGNKGADAMHALLEQLDALKEMRA
jgi:6,7-dimethyl-8-ribityllumazine synthase